MKCEYFLGEGMVDENWDGNLTPCPECNGTGWIEVDDTYYDDDEELADGSNLDDEFSQSTLDR